MRKTFFPLSCCLAFSASSDVSTRVTEWDWLNQAAEPTTTQCYVEIDSGLDVEVEAGTLYVIGVYDEYSGLVDPDKEMFSVSYDSGGFIYRDPISVESDGYDVYVDYSILTPYEQSQAVYIESEHPAGAETWWAPDAVSSLLLQWSNHTCVDEDGDRYCDSIEMQNGETFPAVPMRVSEQRALTDCLEKHWNTKVSARRASFQIAGDTNLIRETRWSGQCQESPELSTGDLEEPAPHPARREVCAISNYVLFGGRTPASDFLEGGSKHYLCNPSMKIEGSEYTGNHIIRQFEKSRGRFGGFTCPAVEPQDTPMHTEFSTDILKGHKVSRETWRGLQLNGVVR